MTGLTSLRYLDSIRADALRIGELVNELDPSDSPPVGACPEWGVRELTTHLGAVHRMVIAAGNGVKSRSPQHWPQESIDLVSWFRGGLDEMLAMLDQPPETPVWSFDPQGQSIGFWQRRQAMENLIHRIDVEQALGADTRTDPGVTDDAVSEVLDTMMRIRDAAGVLNLPGGTVQLDATDTGTQWVVGDGAPHATISGTSADLALMLWNRATDQPLDVSGDSDLARAFQAAQLTP